jgi:filamentous hemagglutinin family protein
MKTKIPQLTLLSLSLLSSLYGGNLAIENAQVVSGQVSFEGLQSNAATITQHSNKAIVDYQRFDVLAGGAVNFDQPSAQAAILNRIRGADPSFLNGEINANGQVYFVNPAGVTFGPNSIIRADTFMAVAGQIANEDFLAGQLQFDLQGTVSNYGLIETLNDVALLGDRVINAGDIVSKSGVSILSAGDEVLLRENGSTLAVQLSTVDSAEQTGVAIENSGTVEGDEVMFSAGDAYSLALSSSGTIRAAKSAKLHADDGAIEVSGLIVAKSDAGAGRIEIGGTDRGGPGAPIASEVLIADTAVIDASAQVAGEGGDIVIYSSGDTTMLGAIDARSIGAADAGHVEVSGSHVDFGINPWDVLIGQGGSLLIDPTDMTIDQAAADGYTTTLQGGADVMVTTVGSPDVGAEAGDITLNGRIQHSNFVDAGDLTLQAAGSIFINNVTDNGSGSITFDAGDSITVSNQVIAGAPSSGALIQLMAPNGTVTFNTIGSLQLFDDANAQVVAQNLVNSVGAGAIVQSGTGHWQVVLQSWNTAISPNEQTYNGLVSGNKAVFGSTGNTAAITQNEYHFVETPVIGIQVNDDSKTYGDAIASSTYQTYEVDGDTFVNAVLNAGAFTPDTVGNTIIDEPLDVQYSTLGSPTTADADVYTDLTLTGLESTNGYTYDVTAGTFTVHKRALLVTAEDRTRIYGNELVLGTSEFTYIDTHDGPADTVLPNGEVLTTVALGSDTNVATDTTSDVDVYTDEVTVGALSGINGFNPDNYEVTAIAGDLEVFRREITVTALEQEKTYGNVEGFGGTVDSLDGLVFDVTDLSQPQLPNGEEIISTTMQYAFGADLGKSTTTGVGTTTDVIEITGVTGNTGDLTSKAFNVDNYDITFVKGQYTIAPRPITVTARQQGKQYGEDFQLVNTEFDVLDNLTSGSLLPNGELIDSVVVASAGGYDSSTTQVVGTYTDDLVISARDTVSNGFNEANYAITYVEGTLKIDPRMVTLTALQQSKLYGDTMTLDGELFTIADQGDAADSALPNGEMIDTVTLLSATGVAGSTTADVQMYVNEIKITDQAGSASFDAANYDFTYVDGNLLVSPRPITVTALEQVKTYGESVDLTNSTVFTLEDVSLGASLPNGETINSVNLLSAGDNGSSTSAAGSYSDDLSIAALNTSTDFDISNYDPTYVKGDFLVNRRSITISLLDQVKPYGEPYGFDSEAFTLYDPLSDTANLPNGEQVVGVNFQTPTMNPITAAPGAYESLLQGESAIGSNNFDASNYSITFNPADLTVYYINDIEAPIVPGEASLDQQQYVYARSPFAQFSNPTPPISANGFSSIVERPEWTSMTPVQQAWVFSQVAHIQRGAQLSEELVEYLIAGAKAQ